LAGHNPNVAGLDFSVKVMRHRNEIKLWKTFCECGW
jgi:hypothetical protein